VNSAIHQQTPHFCQSPTSTHGPEHTPTHTFTEVGHLLIRSRVVADLQNAADYNVETRGGGAHRSKTLLGLTVGCLTLLLGLPLLLLLLLLLAWLCGSGGGWLCGGRFRSGGARRALRDQQSTLGGGEEMGRMKEWRCRRTQENTRTKNCLLEHNTTHTYSHTQTRARARTKLDVYHHHHHHHHHRRTLAGGVFTEKFTLDSEESHSVVY
jgi:hypothetical protein